MGPMILGHSPAGVREAVDGQLERGILFAGQSEVEVEAARLVCELVPCAERVRFGSSGLRGGAGRLRLARAATGRRIDRQVRGPLPRLVRQHPVVDRARLERGRPGDSPTPVAGSAGQDPEAAGGIEVLAWNDLDRLERRASRRATSPAVIMEAGHVQRGRDRARARLSRGRARGLHPARHGADLRRGDHRLPPRRRAARRSASA